ncbi:MAG TPA: MFS transporter [Candidatus Eisenbergiella merdavium]|uniref:MFS transporter n=1 Tax=Candidatus Eisenbergiella merdavium TaxID=2838551 RepID=A0A9D2SRA9_9FIRM|nr:MFS transporter [Candidatus Eisenbergiella merdavium]
MKSVLATRGQRNLFCFLCCLVYFMSYLTRMNYAACLAEIQDSLSLAKSVVSIPVTGSFLTYGAGQLLCGFLGDRFSPRKMITAGLAATCTCNLLVGLFPDIRLIIPVWCMNGLFQSMLWPPLVRIMAETLDEKQYRKCCVQVSMASSMGTVFVYLFVPLCIRFANWRAAFLFPAFAGVLTALVWFTGIGRLQADGGNAVHAIHVESASESSVRMSTLLLQAALLPAMIAIILHGILRDGITTWMPVYISETFGLSNSVSILTAAVLPVFSILSIYLASAMLERIRNEFSASALLFGAAACCSALLVFLYRHGPVPSVVLMTLTAGCMYGINLFLISRLPAHFSRFGKVATVSGILNASTYVGSALSAWLFGLISDRFGWIAVISMWILIALGGALICGAFFRRWSRFSREG